MTHARALVDAGVKFIDLAADFRLRNPETWKQWYGMEHACPDLLEESVYGLPELYREQIKEARIVANPGCYPTTVSLGALPLLENSLVQLDDIIADVSQALDCVR